MIGILARSNEREIVSEFFELFKTPWEFFNQERYYDVVIVTATDFSAVNAKLVILYGSEENIYDVKTGIKTKPLRKDKVLQIEDVCLPLYGQLSEISGYGQPIYRIKNSSASAGAEINDKPYQRIVRIGYDLFHEIAYLLSTGQPPENAHIPTLELHISLLRKLILDAGISFIEIPPVPAGYHFITFLSHDIDFIRIRDHKFDHTMFGFLYRASVGSLLDVIKAKRTLKELYQNWKAVLMLPLVYLGLCRDFWFSFDRYMELEENVGARSTFFFIPYKNKMGDNVPGKDATMRAAKYDVTDIQDTLKHLVQQGFEVGVHGIDAWHNLLSAQDEKKRISDITAKSNVGVRMHWLCFDRDTHLILDKAEFSFDSTFGYNDAVGYRAGTPQAFRPIGAKYIFELPLHIQDTALFNPKHMSLSKNEAWKKCEELIKNASYYGGILTILWHDRSLSPERLYEDIYIKLLNELKCNKAWFATASDICNWFQSRRSINFDHLENNSKQINVSIDINNNKMQPSFYLRRYHPDFQDTAISPSRISRIQYKDTVWNGDRNVVVDI